MHRLPDRAAHPEQTEAFREHARAEAERLGRRERRRTSRQARRTLAPMTGDGTPAAESRLVPAGDGRSRTQRERDQALAARASTSLLGLIDPTADPES